MEEPSPDTPALMARLHELADPQYASRLQGVFKTEAGRYGHGDRFLGIRVPVLRRLARLNPAIHIHDAARLLRTPFHEARMLALIILADQFAGGSEAARRAIYNLYMEHTEHINSWDLVDVSAGKIAGAYLQTRSRAPLYELAESTIVWERRIAVIATLPYIKQNDFADTLVLAGQLIHDKEDLIQKAVGWMLREIGKRDTAAEEAFLKKYCRTMARSMLKYAIEKFPEGKRKQYLKGIV